MKQDQKEFMISFFQCVILLIMVDIFATTLLPTLGLKEARFPLHIIFVLYLSIRIDSAYLPLSILFIEGIHGSFTFEGWAYGTFAGIILSLCLVPFKGLLHFSNTLVTICLSLVFQIFWFIIVHILLVIKLGNSSQYNPNWLSVVIESLLFAIITPSIFHLLSKIFPENSNQNKAII